MLTAGDKVENVIAVVADAVESALALQRLRIFRILMSAIGTDQKNASSRPNLPDVGQVPTDPLLEPAVRAGTLLDAVVVNTEDGAVVKPARQRTESD